jgi:hypothetical protein
MKKPTAAQQLARAEFQALGMLAQIRGGSRYLARNSSALTRQEKDILHEVRIVATKMFYSIKNRQKERKKKNVNPNSG